MNDAAPLTRRSLRACTLVVMLVCVYVHAAAISADEPHMLSVDVAANAVSLTFAPEAVFSESSSNSITLASFDDSATDAALRVSASERDDSPGTTRWNSSNNRLAGLSGQSVGPATMTDLLPRLVGVTLSVLVTCAASLWFARRWLTSRGFPQPTHNTSRLAVTESLTIATHSHLHLVRVDDREFLASANSQGLQQLVAIPSDFGDLIHTFDRQATA